MLVIRIQSWILSLAINTEPRNIKTGKWEIVIISIFDLGFS